jgi:arylsulfatase
MKGNRFYALSLIYAALALLLITGAGAAKENGKIVHDAEYYILEAQNGEKWAADDKEVDRKLAEFRQHR